MILTKKQSESVQRGCLIGVSVDIQYHRDILHGKARKWYHETDDVLIERLARLLERQKRILSGGD